MRLRKRAVAALPALLVCAGLSVPGSSASAEPAQNAGKFSLAGVSWPSAQQPAGAVQLRTRAAGTGAWSPWHTLDVTPRQTESGARTTTEPRWTGPAVSAQARVVRADGSSTPLPRGARIEKVRDQPAEAAPQLLAGKGVIKTRKQWGANESWRGDPPEYGSRVKAVLVHHTVDSNSYSCSDAPSIIRAIYRYHVKTNGWNDIGYNFLVDRCGRIYEGRYGGGSKPVVGAHSMGFNNNTSGVAVIGDYRSKAVPSKVTAILARFARWKLKIAGYNAGQKVTLEAGVSNGKYDKGDKVRVSRVAAHRNVFATSCPGAKLYAKLGAIRRAAD
ncbi:peptidoglycan recognition protein [Streptomyces boninensis]|uniref:peptidoglycan recognition protein family protein n=1 Tax=Streptomyces boninensis TaxID=2039455 RepID=UPI003B221644